MRTEGAATSSEVRQSLLLATRQLIANHGLRGFTIDDVARDAFVSKSALYHHFSNLQELIEVSLLSWFEEMIDADLQSIASLSHAKSNEEFRLAMNDLNEQVYEESRRTTRINRAVILASAAYGSPALAEGFRRAQQRLHGGFAQMVEVLKDRKIFRSEVDPGSVASLMIAITFGMAFNEAAEISTDEDEWLGLLGKLLDALI